MSRGHGQWRPPVLLRPGGRGKLVRNVATQRVLPCCWDDCTEDGNDRIRVEIPHPTPRWKDSLGGKQEMLIYIFCSDGHRNHYLARTPLQDRG